MLATNVAETSLTVPGIRYVIDSGLARVKRYSLRNKMTLLQIEKIAQAAAEQRAGRCGRVAAGICVRLYGEDDFAARPRFTEPEILRSSLAAVILRMAALDLGEVDAFPFLEPPGPRAIADGYQLLQELAAVDARARADRRSAASSRACRVDPRIGRMVLAARDIGCLAEVLVIASALAVPDPRERPLEKQQAADQAHLRFRDERSDFLSLLALWQFFADALAEKLSHRRLVERCRAHFVSYLRLREWRDLHRAARRAGARAGLALDPKRCPTTIDAARYATHPPRAARRAARQHRHQGRRRRRLPGRARHQVLPAPGIGPAPERPRNGCSRPSSPRPRACTRAARRRSSPNGSRRSPATGSTRDLLRSALGQAAAARSSRASACTLYGLTLVARRRVSFGAIDPAAAREVFHPRGAGGRRARTRRRRSSRTTAGCVAEVAELEHKARRQDVLVDDEAIVAFYAERMPEDISTRRRVRALAARGGGAPIRGCCS